MEQNRLGDVRDYIIRYKDAAPQIWLIVYCVSSYQHSGQTPTDLPGLGGEVAQNHIQHFRKDTLFNSNIARLNIAKTRILEKLQLTVRVL